MLLNYINVINVLIDIEYVGMTTTEICWTIKQEGSLSHKPLLFFPKQTSEPSWLGLRKLT